MGIVERVRDSLGARKISQNVSKKWWDMDIHSGMVWSFTTPEEGLPPEILCAAASSRNGWYEKQEDVLEEVALHGRNYSWRFCDWKQGMSGITCASLYMRALLLSANSCTSTAVLSTLRCCECNSHWYREHIDIYSSCLR